MKDLNCTYYFNDLRPHSGPSECDPLWDKIQNMTIDLNWYDLYEPASASPLKSIEERKRTVEVGGEKKTYISGRTKAEYTPWVKHFGSRSVKQLKVEGEPVSDYLNSKETRAALNIPDSAPAWNQCVS